MLGVRTRGLLVLSLLTCFCPSESGVSVAELSLQVLALDCGVAEAFPVEILRGVASAVAPVPYDWHDHPLVAFVA